MSFREEARRLFRLAGESGKFAQQIRASVQHSVFLDMTGREVGRSSRGVSRPGRLCAGPSKGSAGDERTGRGERKPGREAWARADADEIEKKRD